MALRAASQGRGPRRPRKVVNRLVASYAVLLTAFSLTVGSAVASLRAGARDAEVLRAGYVPLLVRIGETLAAQNVLDAQLNHITAARNPGDVKDWIETARRARPAAFASLREAAKQTRRTAPGDEGITSFVDDVEREVSSIEQSLTSEPDGFARLFRALSAGDREGAERARDELARREARAAVRLRSLRERVENEMEVLIRLQKGREARSLTLSLGLGAFTLLVGLAVTLYARRVLGPLSRVTERANAVAEGDLSPREPYATDDEIGELSTNFEAMVGAIQRARAELVHAERLAAIGKMAAHITHEIRNPLSSIGLNVELLEEELSRGREAARAEPGLDEGLGSSSARAEVDQLLAAIRSEIERLAEISEQYLSVARRRAPKLREEHLDELAEELVSFVKPELDRAGVTLELELEGELPTVRADEAQLRQALVNLLRNAREATPKGGRVTVRLRQSSGGVELCVDDTGPGVPDELRASIFDPFFTTKERGTGLGLAVTREIVEAHGGTIRCEGRPGGGTRFVLELPLSGPIEPTEPTARA